MKELNVEKMTLNVEKRICSDIENSYIGGASILVAQHGKVLLDKAYGYSDYENRVPLKEDDIFRIASMSKPILGAAAAILADEGRLDLYAKISDYLPEFSELYIAAFDNHGIPTRDKKIENAPLVHQLFNHSSGLGSGMTTNTCYLAPDRASESLEAMVKYYSQNLCCEFEPGSRSNYSGVAGFDIAARIIEVVTGEDYRDFVRKNIFEPLGMNDTFYVPNEEQEKRVVTMFFHSQHGSYNLDMHGKSYVHSSKGYSPAGAGVFSTSRDYARFAQMLANGGVYEGKRILSEGAFKILTAKYLPDDIPLSVENSRWALGFTIETADSWYRNKGTYYWGGAFGTVWFADPENELIAVYMKNSFYSGLTFAAWGQDFESDVISALE